MSVDRSCVPDMAKVGPCADHQISHCKSHPVGAGFEDVKGSGRADEAWHCVAVLKSTKRTLDRLLVNVWLELKRCQCCGMITESISISGVEVTRAEKHALSTAGVELVKQGKC